MKPTGSLVRGLGFGSLLWAVACAVPTRTTTSEAPRTGSAATSATTGSSATTRSTPASATTSVTTSAATGAATGATASTPSPHAVAPNAGNAATEARVEASTTAPTPRARADAARILDEALSQRGGEPAVELERLRAAARAAQDVLGPRSLNVARLSAAVDVPTSDVARDGTRAVARVRRALQRLALDLAFEPKVEAPRPVGFPDATPVGEIAVLDYPTYRMARVDMDARGDTGAFWKLFRHIESNQIAMTAPVEVAYRRDGTREDSASMAFLYADQQIGRVGDAGGVTVLDVPAATVVSTGLRGSYDETRMRVAREELRAWLREHPEYVEVGPARSMGWNSPMVPDARRFTEVQIVVRRAGAERS